MHLIKSYYWNMTNKLTGLIVKFVSPLNIIPSFSVVLNCLSMTAFKKMKSERLSFQAVMCYLMKLRIFVGTCLFVLITCYSHQMSVQRQLMYVIQFIDVLLNPNVQIFEQYQHDLLEQSNDIRTEFRNATILQSIYRNNIRNLLQNLQ